MSRAQEEAGAVVPVEPGAPQPPLSEGKDAAEQPHEVNGSDWGGAMLLLLPPLLIRNFTGLGTGWLVIAWVFWSLAAAVMALIWVLMRERGVRQARGWFSCALAHSTLAVNALLLVEGA